VNELNLSLCKCVKLSSFMEIEPDGGNIASVLRNRSSTFKNHEDIHFHFIIVDAIFLGHQHTDVPKKKYLPGRLKELSMSEVDFLPHRPRI
jgi:hypothetical protein